MTIANKLWVGFGILLLLLTMTDLIIHSNIRAIERDLREVTAVAEPTSAAIYEMKVHLTGTVTGVLQYLYTSDPQYREQAKRHEVEFERFKAQYDRLARTARGKELGQRVELLYQEHKMVGESLLSKKDNQEVLAAKLSESFERINEIINKKIKGRIGREGSGGLEKRESLANMDSDIAKLNTHLGNYLRTPKKEYEERINREASSFRWELNRFKNLNLTPVELYWSSELGKTFNQSMPLVQEVLAVKESLQGNTMKLLHLQKAIESIMDEEAQALTGKSPDVAQEATGQAGKAHKLVLVMLILSLIIGSSAAVITSRKITRPIRELVAEAHKVGSGALDHRIEVTTKDETGELAVAFNRMMESCRQTEGRIRELNESWERRLSERTEQLEATNKELQNQIGELVRKEEERAQLLAHEQAARAEAEAANRAKDEFLALISHELRKPLTSLLGWTRLLRAGNLGEVVAARALTTIERNAKSHAQIIEDIMDVSDIIRGKLSLDVRPVELAPVIEVAIDDVRPAAHAKGIRIRSVLEPGAGSISGDPDRLQQVIRNLLSNAVEFTPKGGRIQVRLERADAHAQITVSDTGVGISAEFLPHVFDRLRPADATGVGRQSGLGLELAIARHLVELHGGTIHAESPGEGQGATFTVRLPLAPLRVADSALRSEEVVYEKPTTSDLQPAIRNPQSAILNGLGVLVVDDEVDARDLLTIVLEQYGAKVIAVASAGEALEALKRLRPDVLVSDLGMPGEDGYALIRKVRTLEPERGGQIPAVALTAYAKRGDRLRALSAGYQRHVSKPVEPTELVAAVASVTGRAARQAGA